MAHAACSPRAHVPHRSPNPAEGRIACPAQPHRDRLASGTPGSRDAQRRRRHAETLQLSAEDQLGYPLVRAVTTWPLHFFRGHRDPHGATCWRIACFPPSCSLLSRQGMEPMEPLQHQRPRPTRARRARERPRATSSTPPSSTSARLVRTVCGTSGRSSGPPNPVSCHWWLVTWRSGAFRLRL